MTSTEWDYSSLAAHYDKRADYADTAIDWLLAAAQPAPTLPIADVGAGTGKLTKLLLARGWRVHAVEPNAEMRAQGQRNTSGTAVTWSDGTGEATALPAQGFDLVTFGSSFNVTDRARALLECARILRPRGWFACLWNHRDLADPVQKSCEEIIRRHVPGFGYGTRREDQAPTIRASGLFDEPLAREFAFVATVTRCDFIEAWRSHGTLQRQAGALFSSIIDELERALAGQPTLVVPYTTRLWCARLR